MDHCKAVVEAELCNDLIGQAAVERGAKVVMSQRTVARGELFEALLDEIDKVRETTKSREVHAAFSRLLERVALLSSRWQPHATGETERR